MCKKDSACLQVRQSLSEDGAHEVLPGAFDVNFHPANIDPLNIAVVFQMLFQIPKLKQTSVAIDYSVAVELQSGEGRENL